VKFLEYKAKEIFARYGIPIARGVTASGPDDIVDPPLPCMVKAQVLVGGRGKAGGVKLAGSPDEAAAVADGILGMDIKGMTVRKVLVGPAADIRKEFYLAALVDRGEHDELFKLGEVIEGAVDRCAVEHQLRRKDDSLLWCRTVMALVRDGEGDPNYGIGMLEDITNRKYVEEELMQRAVHDPGRHRRRSRPRHPPDPWRAAAAHGGERGERLAPARLRRRSGPRLPGSHARFLRARASVGRRAAPLRRGMRGALESRWHWTNLRRHTSFSLVGSPERALMYASGGRLALASSGSQLGPVPRRQTGPLSGRSRD